MSLGPGPAAARGRPRRLTSPAILVGFDRQGFDVIVSASRRQRAAVAGC